MASDLPGLLTEQAELDRLRPSPRVGWRTVDEIATHLLGQYWRHGPTSSGTITFLERALNRLVWNGVLERQVYGEWTWWRAVPT